MPIAVNSRLSHFLTAGLLVLLQACASAPSEEPVASEPEEDQELTLNLPEQEPPLPVAQPGLDDTFFDRGFSSLVVGDHVEAVTYFQRYQRTESSPVANWQAEIAIAYDSMLPQSPFYDPDAARKTYRRLKQE